MYRVEFWRLATLACRDDVVRPAFAGEYFAAAFTSTGDGHAAVSFSWGMRCATPVVLPGPPVTASLARLLAVPSTAVGTLGVLVQGLAPPAALPGLRPRPEQFATPQAQQLVVGHGPVVFGGLDGGSQPGVLPSSHIAGSSTVPSSMHAHNVSGVMRRRSHICVVDRYSIVAGHK